MYKVVETYVTKHGGIVQITEDDASEWSPTGKCYDARWSYDFLISLRLGEGSAFSGKLENTLEYVRRWDPDIQLIEDFGEFILYARDEKDGTIAVNLEQDYGCERPIKAKDVPVGSFLVMNADRFFCWWKGKEAVDGRRLIK